MICIDTKDGEAMMELKEGGNAHVVSDLPGEEGTNELEAFGRKVGLPHFFIQDRGTPQEHFDVWGSKLPKAVEHADREVGVRGVVRIIQKKRDIQNR